MPVPPARGRAARGNAFAQCGCLRCEELLLVDMEHYISTVVSRSFHARRHRDEAYAAGCLMLLEVLDDWPAGKCDFAPWFGGCLGNRLKQVYAPSAREEEQTASLDTTFLTDALGRSVSLYELVPDRSRNPLSIVLFLEFLRELQSERHGAWAEGAEEYMAARHAEALELLQRDEGY